MTSDGLHSWDLVADDRLRRIKLKIYWIIYFIVTNGPNKCQYLYFEWSLKFNVLLLSMELLNHHHWWFTREWVLINPLKIRFFRIRPKSDKNRFVLKLANEMIESSFPVIFSPNQPFYSMLAQMLWCWDWKRSEKNAIHVLIHV